MKNDTVHSSVSANRGRYQKRSRSGVYYDNGLAKLKRATVVLPIVIVLVIVIALIIGVHQYTALFDEVQIERPFQNVPVTVEDNGKLMTVVSPENPLPSDYKINIVSCCGVEVDKTVEEGLTLMLKEAENAGLSLKAVKGYVSPEEQHELYMEEVRKLTESEGYGNSRASEEAEKIAPMENHAEQQTGLLVSFSSESQEDFQNTDEYLWLMKNSIKYGFILRYPEGKEIYTGFSFDPELFRYVGIENATKIRTLDMCLDEYISYVNSRK